MSMIHYAFGKYVEFVLSTRQIVATTPIDQLQYAVNKTVFTRSASLGKVEKSVRRLPCASGEAHLRRKHTA